MINSISKTCVALIAVSYLLSPVVFAQSAALSEDDGIHYMVNMVQGDGVKIKVADLVLFEKDEGTFQYELKKIKGDPFRDYFLAMRPFECLLEETRKDNLCYLAYPYENNHTISKTDLTDLEYDLLFVRRKSTDYAIDLWDGSYYKLKWQDDEIVGESHEVDLDILAAPPEDGSLRPIAESDLTLAELDKLWLPSISIERVKKH